MIEKMNNALSQGEKPEHLKDLQQHLKKKKAEDCQIPGINTIDVSIMPVLILIVLVKTSLF